MMRLVAPSLLAADFLNLGRDVDMVNSHADIIHLDVMDGVFVPNLSFGFPVVEAVAAKAEKTLDVHLMIVHPEKYLERFARTGAEMISFHLEACTDAGLDPRDLLRTLRSYDVKPGLAIDPDIPPQELFPFIDDADYVLIMSVFAGFGGQKFIEETYDRVRTVRDEISARGLDCHIEVDGGVSSANAAGLAAAGADILVAGSSVFRSGDPAGEIESIRNS